MDRGPDDVPQVIYAKREAAEGINRFSIPRNLTRLRCTILLRQLQHPLTRMCSRLSNSSAYFPEHICNVENNE